MRLVVDMSPCWVPIIWIEVWVGTHDLIRRRLVNRYTSQKSRRSKGGGDVVTGEPGLGNRSIFYWWYQQPRLVQRMMVHYASLRGSRSCQALCHGTVLLLEWYWWCCLACCVVQCVIEWCMISWGQVAIKLSTNHGDVIWARGDLDRRYHVVFFS